MATDNQSVFQNLIEQGTGVNATAQNSQPANPNNGNPNTVLNAGQAAQVQQVYPLPPQANASGTWWVPPQGSGVDTQAILSQLPTGPTTNIDTIIANLMRPPAGPTPPGNQPPPGNPPPANPPPTNPPGGPTGPGAVGRPVGPISSVVDWWIRNPGMRQPVLGVPPVSITDQLANLGANANLAISEWFRNMAGRRHQ